MQQWQKVYLISASWLLSTGFIYILFADSNIASWNTINHKVQVKIIYRIVFSYNTDYVFLITQEYEENGQEMETFIKNENHNNDKQSEECEEQITILPNDNRITQEA